MLALLPVFFQDIVELDQASKLKEGVVRSPKRIASTDKWFKQTLGDLDRFLAYFNSPK
jgi:hypothetical protein